MNHTLEVIIISIFTISGATLTTSYVNEDMNITFESQNDIMEKKKSKVGEILKVIEFMSDPLEADVLNGGVDNIIIDKIYVDGVLDESYMVDSQYTNIISPSKVTRITFGVIDGENISIITENKNIYNLES